MAAGNSNKRTAGESTQCGHQRHKIECKHKGANASCEVSTGTAATKIDGDDRHIKFEVLEGRRRVCGGEKADGRWEIEKYARVCSSLL